MNLVKHNGIDTVSSRELAEFAGVRHDNMIRDIRKMFKNIGVDLCNLKFEGTYQVVQPQGGTRNSIEYLFPRKEALFVASKFNDQLRWDLICAFEKATEMLINQQHNFMIQANDSFSEVAPNTPCGAISNITGEQRTHLIKSYYRTPKKGQDVNQPDLFNFIEYFSNKEEVGE